MLTSAGRRWRDVSAELRSHPSGERPSNVSDLNEVVVILRGTTVVMRQAEGMRERIVGVPGTIGLCPSGIREDFKTLSRGIDEMLHIYLRQEHMAALASDFVDEAPPTSIDYHAGFSDPLIECIAREILRELQCETSGGSVLVETLGDALAIRLLNSHSGLRLDPFPSAAKSPGLDTRRLQRVIDYIDARLAQPIGVAELAEAASLSRFHFSRMFKTATGQSPSSFIGHRRLEMAKRQLAQGCSISQIAFDCGFSSESNFVRSFRRVVGDTPGQYRRSVRQ